MNVVMDINELCFAYLEASGRFWSISSGAPIGIQDVTHVPRVGRQLTNPDVTISLTNGRRIWACRDGVAHTNAGRGIAKSLGLTC